MSERRTAGMVLMGVAALLLASAVMTKGWYTASVGGMFGKATFSAGLRGVDCDGDLCAKASGSYQWKNAKTSKLKLWIVAGSATFWGGLLACGLFVTAAILLGMGSVKSTSYMNGAIIVCVLLFFSAFIFVTIPRKPPSWSAMLFACGLIAGFVGARMGYKGIVAEENLAMHYELEREQAEGGGGMLNDLFAPKPAAPAPTSAPDTDEEHAG